MGQGCQFVARDSQLPQTCQTTNHYIEVSLDQHSIFRVDLSQDMIANKLRPTTYSSIETLNGCHRNRTEESCVRGVRDGTYLWVEM